MRKTADLPDRSALRRRGREVFRCGDAPEKREAAAGYRAGLWPACADPLGLRAEGVAFRPEWE